MKLRVRSQGILLSCFFALLLSSSLQAQDTTILHPDSLFRQAQQMAYHGKYAESRQLSRKLLRAVPAYTDATLLLARTFAWEHHYDSARFILSPLLSTTPPNEEALLIAVDMALWSHKPDEALHYVQAGLEANPTSAPLLLGKARAQYERQEYAAAEAILTGLLQQDPGNTDVRQVWEKVQQARKVHLVQASYQLTTFDQQLSPWHLGALAYTRQTASGKYLARVSYARRYGNQSMQGEVDAYPQLSKTTYAYLNVGASDEKLFPAYRTGAELYHLFPHKVEASLGARALFFQNETVVLYTGYVGKYFRKQWVSFRPFLQRQNSSWQTTGILQFRQYLRHEDEHFTLVLARGSVPFVQVGLEEISRLSASRAALEAQLRVGNSCLLGGMFSYDYEEISSGSFRNRFTTGLTVQYRF
ncbi:YaiO family outer membrane beta-barrel protein [Pontibacter liquoris]|uniref:YaiO family outer membrane beta-barrel protein n=1 Tax=Pontibacter liquoris TaxID=2905677 RepID=UPI001FA7BCC8|nr:YaiO family outer membrane beta-barrel protein [Pontibacter liquoris]